MKLPLLLPRCVLPLLLCLGAVTAQDSRPGIAATRPAAAELAQVPSWSRADLEFFLHGSMSTEVAPETVLRAFFRTYPDLFPTRDLSHLGLLPDPAFGWPVGFSRGPVAHLGGLVSVGLNCASCHVGEVVPAAAGSNAPASGSAPVRVLGMSSHFDAEAFFGALIVATFRTAEPANMGRFLSAWLTENDPAAGASAQEQLAAQWQRQEAKVASAMAADPFASKGIAAGALHPLTAAALRFDREFVAQGKDLPALCGAVLQLFHNMRAALHVPDQPPDKAPPASGPGRNDAFGLLSAVLFGDPQPFAPVKYGLVWNLASRPVVHWDGNTLSPIGRNLLASLGLGAPLLGKRGQLDFALVKRQTDLTERIAPPRFPFAVDRAAAQRGAVHYRQRCASCHDGVETDARLHDPVAVGTDPLRAKLFTPVQAERFSGLLAGLEIPGYQPGATPGIRSTQKYWAASLAGVWARSPYLHNGSVRTMAELLTAPARRERSFHRGTRTYDVEAMGYCDEGVYLLDATVAGNGNAGHDYGTDLAAAARRDLIEHLKTL